MKIVNGSSVFVSSLTLLSSSIDSVQAFHSQPSGSKLHYRSHLQNVAGNTATASTTLDAASLEISFEEDLALTRQIILDHQARSETVSKEQFVQQMEELLAVKSTSATETTANVNPATASPNVEIVNADKTIDVSVPYDAAARLAYESFDKKSAISFEAFQTQYLVDAVELVKSKQPKHEENEQVRGAVSPPVAVSAAIAAAEERIPEPQSTVADATTSTKQSLIPALASWIWNTISPKLRVFT